MREYDTGATRDDKGEKLCYEGFLNPAVLKRFAEYMQVHRKQSDNKLRDADNWQKGIPEADYMDSLWRHFMDVWMYRRGYTIEVEYEDALCAVLFNIMGLLHERLKLTKEYNGKFIPMNELTEVFPVRVYSGQIGHHVHSYESMWAIKHVHEEEHDNFKLHSHGDGHNYTTFYLSKDDRATLKDADRYSTYTE